MPHDAPGRDDTGGRTRFNRLINEKSPYLLQHATNPVDWYPWGDEAFDRAAREKRPVFLSIGYATCHWCHVMARESFEDPEVAGVLNEGFVCIKVDREERPDIDSLYMSVCHLMTDRCGWPLTIIMTPDQKPFFAGTYIPKEPRFGMAGLPDLLRQVTDLWENRRDDLIESGDRVASALRSMEEPAHKETLDRAVIGRAYGALAGKFDAVHGGFGSAPKFPDPQTLLFLLRYWYRTGTGEALLMVERTLDALRRGGIHDQIGGGFHRYATDREWRVPHFEKMLYDQGLLLMAFTEAFQATGNPVYRKTAEEIITSVNRDFVSPEGAFYSALDADSAEGEGGYYLWTIPQVVAALGEEEGIRAARYYTMSDSGTMAGGTGQNVPFLTSLTEGSETESWAGSIREALFQARSGRPHPFLDDKILTDWNCLYIAALARAARAFDKEEYLKAAERAMRFLLDQVRDGEGRLMHRYRDGEASVGAFCGDYAFAVRALIELYEAAFEPAYLSMALDLNARLIDHFWDGREGGFFTTSDEEKALLVRKKEILDAIIPSSNAVALENLIRLSRLTADPDLEQRGSALAAYFSGTVGRSPAAAAGFLCALDMAIGPTPDVVITGRRDDIRNRALVTAVNEHYLPGVMVQYIPQDESADLLLSRAPFLRAMDQRPDQPTAYVCTGQGCALPVHDPDEMLVLLENKKRGSDGQDTGAAMHNPS